MEINPNFYAIIPATVRYDKDLSPLAKLLYGEITALTSKEGFCWASNKYFADLYGVTETWISLTIKKLNEKGLVRIEYPEGNERRVYLTEIDKTEEEPLTTVKPTFNKSKSTPLTKVKAINTVNTTVINTHTTPSEVMRFFVRDYEGKQENNPDLIATISQQTGLPETKVAAEVHKFMLYWTEPTKDGKRQRWELEKTFELGRRLSTWMSRTKEYAKVAGNKLEEKRITAAF